MRETINIKLTLLQAKEINNLLVATYHSIAQKSISKGTKTRKNTRLLAAIKSFCQQSNLSEDEITTIELAIKSSDDSYRPENKN